MCYSWIFSFAMQHLRRTLQHRHTCIMDWSTMKNCKNLRYLMTHEKSHTALNARCTKTMLSAESFGHIFYQMDTRQPVVLTVMQFDNSSNFHSCALFKHVNFTSSQFLSGSPRPYQFHINPLHAYWWWPVFYENILLIIFLHS